MIDVTDTIQAEDQLVRDYQVSTYACRQLAGWALAHFDDRTEPLAYMRIVLSLARTGPDYVIDKILRDLTSQGNPYRSEAIWRMYERYRAEGERTIPATGSQAA